MIESHISTEANMHCIHVISTGWESIRRGHYYIPSNNVGSSVSIANTISHCFCFCDWFMPEQRILLQCLAQVTITRASHHSIVLAE